MNKHILGLPIFVLASLLISACSPAPNQANQTHAAGADSDAHGCKGSAGYLWCDQENQCVRPWELAKEKGFENSQEAFNQHCR